MKMFWKRKQPVIVLGLIFVLLFVCACGGENGKSGTEDSAAKADVDQAQKKYPREKLPDDIKWLTNTDDPVFSSPDAKKGGIFHTAILTFPPTFRVVGPDSNSGFRSAILDNQLSLIGIHPNTENIIPELATHWAFSDDKKTMYFKLNENARWSDGAPVTADDFAYTLDFMRSKHIVAPWYNDYYTKEIDRVIIFDDYTLAVVATKVQPDLHLRAGLSPTPKHFYGALDENFVQKYNWEIVPNTGPYQMSEFKKGQYVKFKRKKDWWARDLHYFKNRFNVDTVIFDVVRDPNIIWEYFKKSKIDVFGVTEPKYWHDKTKTAVVEKGYVYKIWFFNDTQQSAQGMWLNQDKEIFKDRNVRYAFAYGMNVEKVIEKVLRGDYFRLEHGFMGYGRYSNTKIRARRFDLKKVDYYMKKAGWKRGADGIWEKNGQRFSVEVTYWYEDHTPRLVVLKEEAKKAGIELRLDKLDQSAWYRKVVEKKHDVAWVGWSTSLRPQYWEHFHSENAHKPQTNNITNTDDPEMDKLIDAFRNSLKEEERIGLSKKIQAKIHEIGCYVPTFMVPYVRQAYWRWWRLPKVPGTKHTGDLFDPFSSGTGGLFWYDEQLYKETKEARKKGLSFEPVTIIDETYKMKSIHIKGR